VEQVLEVEDVLLLLPDLAQQGAIELAHGALAANGTPREWSAREARPVYRRAQPGRGIAQRAADRLRRQLVLEQLAACRIQLLRESAGVAVLLPGLRVPLRGGLRILGRGLLLQPISQERHQPLPERLRADQRLAGVLRGREHLDRLGGRDAA